MSSCTSPAACSFAFFLKAAIPLTRKSGIGTPIFPRFSRIEQNSVKMNIISISGAKKPEYVMGSLNTDAFVAY